MNFAQGHSEARVSGVAHQRDDTETALQREVDEVGASPSRGPEHEDLLIDPP
jgi:hypothetical protein